MKGLVTRHGGTIEARSAGLGCGSEFIVRLPAALVLTSRSPVANVVSPEAEHDLHLTKPADPKQVQQTLAEHLPKRKRSKRPSASSDES